MLTNNEGITRFLLYIILFPTLFQEAFIEFEGEVLLKSDVMRFDEELQDYVDD